MDDDRCETSVDLPTHVEEPLEVYINGVRQELHVDYEIVDRSLIFFRPLEHEGKLGPMRWLSMLLGVAGTYRKHESVDVVHESDGRRLVEAGLRPRDSAAH